jgi:large subunit ribosomal protein L9
MEVILSQDIERIGHTGQVVKVKDGFARNYLFPNKLAVPLTTGNVLRLEQEKRTRTLHLEKVKQVAEALKEKLAGVSLTIPVLTQEGEEALYGSITNLDVARALKDEGFDIAKAFIDMAEPIKNLGIYEIPVKVHPEIIAKVKVWIVKR